MRLPWRRRRRVVVYTRAGCGLCREAEAVVASIADRSEVSRIVALAERFADREAFSLLQLGVKGFLEESATRFVRAVKAAATPRGAIG